MMTGDTFRQNAGAVRRGRRFAEPRLEFLYAPVQRVGIDGICRRFIRQ